MRRDPDLINRIILTLLGIACVAVSVWGLGRAGGWFDSEDPDQPLLLPSVVDYVARNAHWFWPLAAGVAVLIALLGLWWLRGQLRLPRRANTDLVVHETGNTTRVEGGGLAAALQADVTTSITEARSASARVVADSEDAEIDLRVELEEDADLDDARDRIEQQVLPRFARAATLSATTTYLDLRLEPARRRVA